MTLVFAAKNPPSSIVKDQWPSEPGAPFGFCGTQISSRSTVVGFCGMGRIAQATLHRLVSFGVRNVVYHSRSPSPDEAILKAKYNLETMNYVSLDDLACTSDLIIVLTPGGKATYHLIDDAFLRKCKKTATIVNTARGTVVDSDALALALKEERIWSAGLDVVEGEPNILSSHPLVKEPRHVWSCVSSLPMILTECLSRCVIVPHIGSATLETRTAMYAPDAFERAMLT